MKYYNAYDDRYKKIHEKNLTWFPNESTPEVLEWIKYNEIADNETICEFGCGEGRDAIFLSQKGYLITGIDISSEAIKLCKKIESDSCHNQNINWVCADLANKNFQLVEKYSYIYSIATLHMLVNQEDRISFLRNLHSSLKENGKVLLVNKGNGKVNQAADPSKAFEMSTRVHYETKEEIEVATTTYMCLKWEDYLGEIESNGFKVIKHMNTFNEIYEECMTVYLEKC